MDVCHTLLLWLTLSLCHTEANMRRECDNGKRSAETDLIPDATLTCPEAVWPEPNQTLPSSDTKYTPQPPLLACMDSSISYSHAIPNSGAHRPVGAESGDYRYCPPQRWVNNLRHGATVLLYHPCASISQHSRLSLLARSCLSHYVVTPFPQLNAQRPLALVTWGRTLELSHMSTEVCDWLSLNAQEAVKSKATGSYRLLLKQPSDPRLLRTTRQEDTQQVSSRRQWSEVNNQQQTCLPESGAESFSSPKALKHCCLDTLSLHVEGSIAREQRRWRREVIGQEMASRTDKEVKDRKRGGGMKAPQLAEPTLQSRPGEGHRNITHEPLSDPEHGARKVGLRKGVGPQDTDSKALKRVGGAKENGSTIKAQIGVEPGEQNREDKVKTQKKHERQGGSPQGQVPPVPGGPNCVGTQAEVPAGATGQILRVPTPRTDEAAWAAAALGFLLVLLALSVLHTRLYRNWRSPLSLYWRHPEQDYDSVAEVIRRRLKMVGRRKRKGTPGLRREYVLLPSSSSEESN